MLGAVQRRVYASPPIEEAVVEFQFAVGPEWDPTIPGKLHQHPSIREVYQGTPRQRATTQAHPAAPNGLMVVERVQLVDAATTRIISLARDVLSVNALRPYEGWTSFRPRIDTGLRAYADVVGVTAITRIGFRYINKVVLPAARFNLSTYFEVGPRSPKNFDVETGSFMTRVEYTYDEETKLLLTFVSVDPPAIGSSAFVLDIDEVWSKPSAVSLDGAMPIVDRLHTLAGQAFEASITDETRTVIDAP